MEVLNTRKSICYMSLADAFLTKLREEVVSKTRSKIGKGVNVEVVPVYSSKSDFMDEYLYKLYMQKHGTFCKPKVYTKQVIYECERSNTCKGRSTGNPTQTRANGCTAYVSFLFEDGATVTACVVRFRLAHIGHDPANRDEAKVNRVDPTLRGIIKEHILEDMKITDILNEVAKWNKVQGNTDHRDRRFFPSRQDIQQLVVAVRKPLKKSLYLNLEAKHKKGHTTKKENILRLLRSDLREVCMFYQVQTTSGMKQRPLVIVLQNNLMRDKLIHLGQDIVFVQKNFEGLCQYGYALYVLVVQNGAGHALPCAYVVTSSDEPEAFAVALQRIKEKSDISPRILFLEKDLHTFLEMMSEVYPESLVLIPWYSVLQAIHKWLSQSMVAEKEHADIRKALLQYACEMRSCEMEEEFLLALSEMEVRIVFEGFTIMLHSDLLPLAQMWANYGRNFAFENLQEIASAERFFQCIKHQFLKGLHTTQSLEELLVLIDTRIHEHQSYSNGIVNVSVLLEGTANDQAAVLMLQGWGQLIVWHNEWTAIVPCQNNIEKCYSVNLVTMTCECTELIYSGPCLHLCLALTFAQSRDGPTVEQERHRLASEAYENSDYILDSTSCVTFHSGVMCISDIEGGKCTCISSRLDAECVGKILLKIVQGREEAVTYTQLRTKDSLAISALCNDSVTLSKSSSNLEGLASIDSEVDLKLETVNEDVKKNCSVVPIKIQTQTSSKEENRPEQVDKSNDCPEINTIIRIVEEENPLSKEVQKKSSLKLIEELHTWAKSSKFQDTKELHNKLSDISKLIGSQNVNSVLPEYSQVIRVKKRKPLLVGNKALRAEVRPSKIARGKALHIKEEVEEEEEEFSNPAVSRVQTSRSGRHIRIKEEPDFVTLWY